MPFPLVIEVTETQPAEMSGRAWRRALKAAHEAQGRAWRDRYLARHFEASAKGRYAYQPRNTGYLIRKRGEAKIGKVLDGGFVDLVYTGRLKEYMLGTGVVRAFPTRCTITMQGPRYITMVPYRSNQPDKAKEVCAVTEEERTDLAAVCEEALQREIKAWDEPRTYRIDGIAPVTSVTGFFHLSGED